MLSKCAKSQYFLLAFLPVTLNSESLRQRDPVPLRYWPAPLYWQAGMAPAERAINPTAAAASLPPGANPLVFVAMTPCRVADTPSSQGFPRPSERRVCGGRQPDIPDANEHNLLHTRRCPSLFA
jgi:hypothetical protein